MFEVFCERHEVVEGVGEKQIVRGATHQMEKQCPGRCEEIQEEYQ